MSVVDPIVMALLAAADMLLLIGYKHLQARRYRMTRIQDALALAVRQANGEGTPASCS
jgi:hypothetical protein